MNTAPTSLPKCLLLVLLVIGCSSDPTGPSSPATEPAPSNLPPALPAFSFGLIRITVKTTGQNIPDQFKFFLCRSTSCDALNSLLSGAVSSNGSVLKAIAPGSWRVALALPANCQQTYPPGEITTSIYVFDVTPVTFSASCL